MILDKRQKCSQFSSHACSCPVQSNPFFRRNGQDMPKDNNAFLHLNISSLKPQVWKVEQVEASETSSDATLSDLRIGSLTLTPEFDTETTTYTTSTTNATNTVTAVPSNAGASVKVEVGEVEIGNGSAATWASGNNTVTITVTAEDGTTEKTYTVTVTKS